MTNGFGVTIKEDKDYVSEIICQADRERWCISIYLQNLEINNKENDGSKIIEIFNKIAYNVLSALYEAY